MEQALTYFREAEKIFDANEFESQEDFDMFLQNVFTEIDGMEKRLACHHDGSMLLEKFLSKATGFQLRVFFDRITGEMAKLAAHRYASHVLEALIKRAESILAQEAESDAGQEEENLASLPEMIVRFSSEIGDAFEDSLFNSWGSHVYRGLLTILSIERVQIVSVELETIFENVSMSPTKFLQSLCFDQFASPAFQAILKTARTKKSAFLPTIIKSLLGDSSLAFVKKASSSEYGSHVIETILPCLSASEFIDFYLKNIHPEFSWFYSGTPSNFVIQNAISSCHNESQFGIIMADLKDFIPEMVQARRAGILVRLAQWSSDHKKQSEDQVLSAVYGAFHSKTTAEKKKIFEAVLYLRPVNELEDNSRKSISALGSSILIALTGLSNEGLKPYVDNLLELPSDQLEMIACHPQGSRILEAFISSGKISEKAGARLVKHIQGKMANLAVDKFGSHVIEKLWRLVKAEQKNLIMSELVQAKKRLEDSQYGRIVLRNCRVGEYERRQEDWVKEEASVERKRAYFADILEGEGDGEAQKTSKPKKQKNKKKKTGEDLLLL